VVTVLKRQTGVRVEAELACAYEGRKLNFNPDNDFDVGNLNGFHEYLKARAKA
jgi:hypothetical protein